MRATRIIVIDFLQCPSSLRVLPALPKNTAFMLDFAAVHAT